MCLDETKKARIIEEAKEDADKVFAVYESGDDLVGIVKVYDRLAVLCDVHSDGTIDYFKKGRVCGRATVRLIRNLFGFNDNGLVFAMFKVVRC